MIHVIQDILTQLVYQHSDTLGFTYLSIFIDKGLTLIRALA